jgi:hypothetical protein
MVTDENKILTKADIAVRYSMKPSTVDTLCSRSPLSLPPFFKMGNSLNSPIRFRKSDCDHWDEERVTEALEQRNKQQAPVDLGSLLNP